jgi:hypothetical protein
VPARSEARRLPHCINRYPAPFGLPNRKLLDFVAAVRR